MLRSRRVPPPSPNRHFAAPSPAAAAVQAETPQVAAVAAPPAAPPSRVATRPILTQRVTPNDPMAAVRALSEDELIALFSCESIRCF